MTTTDGALYLEGLSATAGSFRLSPVDLEVTPGHVLVVFGPSGAGKTTLLDAIAGFRPSTAGRIRLGGRDLTGVAPEQRGIGLVFQHAALFPHLSVRENVAFGLRARGFRGEGRVVELLSRFGISEHAGRRPRSLSGGERQRVALARALCADPDLLLLDEPLSALDQPSREELRGLLRNLLSTLGIPAIHVTHDREEALTLADRVAVIVSGRLRQVRAAREIALHPGDADVARLIGWGQLGRGLVQGGTIALGDIELAAEQRSGPAVVLYRPEGVILGPAQGASPPVARLRRIVDRVLPTVPLARVLMGGDPPLTALVLHGVLSRLGVRAGEPIDVQLPPDAVKTFADV